MKKPTQHFRGIGRIAQEGPRSGTALAFKHYDPSEIVDAKRTKP